MADSKHLLTSLESFRQLIESNDQLQKNNTEIQRKYDDVTRQYNIVKDENTRINSSLTSCQKELASYKDEIRLKNDTIKTLQEQNAKEINNFTREKLSLEEEIRKLQSQVRELTDKLKKSEIEVKNLFESKVDLNNKIKTLLDENKRMEEEHRINIDSLALKLKQKENAISKLTDENNEIMTQFLRYKEKAENDIYVLKTQHDTEMAKIKFSYNEHTHEQKVEIDAIRKDLETFSHDLAIHEREASQLRSLLDETTRKLKGAEDKSKNLSSINENLTKEIKKLVDESKRTNDMHRASTREFAEKLREKDEMIASLSLENEKLTSQFSIYKKEVDNNILALKAHHENEIAKLKSSYESRAADQQREIDSIHKELEIFSRDLSSHEEEANHLRSQLNETNNKMKTAENETKNLVSINETLTEQIKQLVNENSTLQEKLRVSTKELSDKLKEKDEAITSLSIENKNILAKFSAFQKKVDQDTTALKNLHFDEIAQLKSSYESHAASQQRESDAIRKELDEFSRDLASHEQLAKDLGVKLSEANNKLRTTEDEARYLISSNESLEKKVKVLLEQNEKIVIELETTKSSFTKTLQELERLKTHRELESVDRKKQINELKSEYKLQMLRLKSDFSKLEQENVELKTRHSLEVSKLTSEIQQFKEEARRKELEGNSKLGEYESREIEYKSAMQILHDKNNELSRIIKASNEKYKVLTDDILRLEEKLETSQKDRQTIAELHNTLNKTEQSRVEILNQNQNLRTEILSMSLKLESAQKKISSLSEQHSEKVSQERVDADETRSRLNQSESQIISLQRENQLLKTKLKETEYKLNLKCDTNTKNEAKIIELQHDLRANQEKLFQLQKIRTSTPVLTDGEKSTRSDQTSFVLRKPKSMSSVRANSPSVSDVTFPKYTLPTPISTPEDLEPTQELHNKMTSIDEKLKSLRKAIDQKIGHVFSEEKNASIERLRSSQKKVESILSEKVSILNLSGSSENSRRMINSKSDMNIVDSTSTTNSNNKTNLSSSASFFSPLKAAVPSKNEKQKSHIPTKFTNVKTSTPNRSRRPPDINLP